MKNLTHFALAVLLFCFCRKADLLVTPVPGKVVPEEQSSQVQNPGYVFSGTNISRKIHPLNAGNAPLFTWLPDQTTGYLIDNGKMDYLTPINAFRFVAVNIQTGSSKIVTIKLADGNAANYSAGRIITGISGMDKKYCVAAKSASGCGGYLIQYDPATQTAVDLG